MTTTNKKDEYQKNTIHKTQGKKEWFKHLEAPSASCRVLMPAPSP
jgi:hypothetical protein